ncbi:MAG: glycosyltransferase [Hydrococcus sp. C42_A2020_068]|uniref:glycosyltransferase n=1 Tax=Pleurocapsa sp. PCC 7327 TaxID=118163 RepID=UPI00029FC526|nr:glycosyltransferase [Pleurocapsa sp. PCC 7327]AFY76910.1 glycosyltransferase [Pleurocapsa sp. PCC 7327]MBF2020807.1 glycosyltransferase [Hydrococcus sp. C42_A2020_068]
MRIAYLTGEYPRATDTFIQREVMALRDRGVEVHTFSVRRTGDEHIVGPEQKAERDRTFYILPPNPLNLILAHLTLLLSSPGRYLRALKLAWTTRQYGLKGNLYQLFYFAEAGILAQQIRNRQIQHLHNHIADSSCTVAMLAAELGGFTYSFTLHGPYIFFEPYRWRLDEKIKRALFVCCISYFCRSQAMLFSPMDKWERLHIIHCGVNPDLFDLVSHDRSSKRLLYVGRLAANKGLPILLESLATLKSAHPDILLTVVGDGSDRVALERMTAQLGLQERVKFVGYKSQAEVRQYLQQTDVFVLPSFAEGVPVVLMEAMAAGVPVVATQIAGTSELVEDGIGGYLVPPGDAVSLAQRIEVLLTDSQLRAKFGASGRLKVEKDFNLDKEVDRLYRVMTSALQGKVEAIRPNTSESAIEDLQKASSA